MPTYVYECSSCNTTFEVQQRITEDPLTSCECGSAGTVKRLIQPIAVMFKGSGFYVNDSKSTNPTAAAPKAETKPETTTEASHPTPPAPDAP